MDKRILSNKSVFLIATMLSTMMLATSSIASLAPATAFAQEDTADDIQSLLPDSTDSTDSADSTNEETNSDNGVGTNDVVVDPVVETAADADTNVNADTHVITDEADCDEVNDEVSQANAQSANQQDRADGEVGDNGLFVSPKVQTALEVGLNVNVDTDVILVDGCNPPSDDLSQANDQSVHQGTGSDVEAGEGSTIIEPTQQISDVFGRNLGVDNDVVRPVL